MYSMPNYDLFPEEPQSYQHSNLCEQNDDEERNIKLGGNFQIL